ncbi:glycosyltransferase [Alicyclobacillus ferrooxydans]|uniref:Glycosyl transferase n=1 Tax=Alicyclobacillus ferrooxydans TaxID=471514 RepID=A0A0P9C817_9BACL|nr:glycosyltransferase [Alicyclobacillus ferrooxydans]KPV39351.1 hypothetical protein AN477_22970 [Alicyclobacillus ferrooxydans]
MRIVLVHDYLNQRGGAERVVAAMHRIYPEAEVHTLLVDRTKLWEPLQDAVIVPSFLQRIPLIRNHFKLFFWLYPFAIRHLKIPECDVVLTSSSAYAKGVRLKVHQGHRPVHVCYCHNPMRFAWDFHRYMEHETKNRALALAAKLLVPLLRRWDLRTSRDVDIFLANSTTVQKRIEKIYGRFSEVVFPPVDIAPTVGWAAPEDYFLVVSRLVSYKRIDLAVRACSRLHKRLIVIGTGPDKERLMSLAGPTVEFLGWQPDEVVREYMARCKALIFPGEEDFGITPVEVNGLGRPVVAYQGGGALDTLVEGLNGVFFPRATVQSLKEALTLFERLDWDSQEIRNLALRFAPSRFESELKAVLHRVVPGNQVRAEEEQEFVRRIGG